MSREGTRTGVGRVPNEALSIIKWLALFAMVYDHVVRFVVSETGGPATTVGRLALPLFAMVLAVNLTRPRAGLPLYRRMIVRLLGFGLLATPAFVMLPIASGWWPLNVFFTFACAVGVLAALAMWPRWWGRGAAVVLLCVGGFFVEYGWPGIVLVLSHVFWFQKRNPSVSAVFVLAGAYMWVALWGANLWVCAALPVVLVAPLLSSVRVISIPRLQWFFYGFYPAHLTLIVLLRWWFGWL